MKQHAVCAAHMATHGNTWPAMNCVLGRGSIEGGGEGEGTCAAAAARRIACMPCVLEDADAAC